MVRIVFSQRRLDKPGATVVYCAPMTTYDFPAPPAVRQPGLDKKRKGLVALLAFLLALTLLIALVAIGGYVYLRNSRSTQWSWQDPPAAVDPAACGLIWG
ncbi:MAG: hypothetical protein V9H69_20155 [Anaerolineae bacterium]